MKTSTRHPLRPARARQRGLGLIDALIALVILSFGMLAMAGFQARMLSQGSDAQVRMIASAKADELLSYALVDTGNKACYTVPAAGGCASSASNVAASWQQSVQATLPGYVAASAALNATNDRLTVSITWDSRDGKDRRTLQATTDVR